MRTPQFGILIKRLQKNPSKPIALPRAWRLSEVTPHPPAGRSGLSALSVHNPSAGESPARFPMKCTGAAGHPLPWGEGGERSEPGEGSFSLSQVQAPFDSGIHVKGQVMLPPHEDPGPAVQP